MAYQKLTPAGLLRLGNTAPEVNDAAWSVRWDTATDVERLVLESLPAELAFHTSGSTGPSRSWLRSREDAWAEAGMLAGFVSREGVPGAVVAFAPPLHVYGALATYLMPARLGVPVWYRKTYAGALPDTGARRVVVVATPWIFSLLLRHMDWVRGLDHLTVLYSSAMLPSDAGTFLEQAGPGRATVVELLGSTETGGVATRRWQGGEPPAWTFFPDVTHVSAATEEAAPVGRAGDGAVPLTIRSPRLAHRPGEPRPDRWHTGDLVEPLGAAGFRLVGRVGRLVKVNGRRVNLDEVEHRLRSVLACRDLALVPVSDPMIGEHVDLHIVPEAGTGLADIDLAPVPALLGARPRKVHVTAGLDRSATGKLLHSGPHTQTSQTASQGD